MLDASRLVLLACLIASVVAATAAEPAADAAVERIAFGSCARQDQPQPVWDAVLAAEPDLFLMIGDNIYADTLDPAVMRAKYAQLGAVPGCRKVRETVPLMAVWDDHDYGLNDAGADHPRKEEAKQAFLDFFEVPADSPRRKREGIYDAAVFGPEGRRVQVILLDTRTFRSPLQRATARPAFRTGPYGPTDDADATVLGEAQWRWLGERLREPAELRIIATSIQAVSNEHGWEKWGNFPRERQRLFDLIHDSAPGSAAGVVLISGDRHHAELSRLDGGPFPLYDLTSSSLNSPLTQLKTSADEPNAHRVGELYPHANFGLIRIDWTRDDPVVTLDIRGLDGEPAVSRQVPLSELSPSAR